MRIFGFFMVLLVVLVGLAIAYQLKTRRHHLGGSLEQGGREAEDRSSDVGKDPRGFDGTGV